MGIKSSKGKKGCRSAGRNKIFCAAYRARSQSEKNQLRRLKKHLIHHPMDLVAGKAIEHCNKMIRGF